MDIFSVLTMAGGLALFLFGMSVMGDGLIKISGGKLERILEKLTSARLLAVLLGAGVTAVIQSSSATTVMAVGFVNAGIMKLSQAAGIIMGANVGTTVTSWLLSLVGIEGSSLFVQLLKPSSFAPALAVLGILLTMTAKQNTRKKDVGGIFLGFAILMFGMETMSDAVAPLADNERFISLFTAFSNPLLGLAAGAVLTAVIQSSSASIGILQALCATGAVGYSAAIPIIMGQNIGTCATALVSSVGASKNAKRTAMIHLYFNVIGTMVFLAVFYGAHLVWPFSFLEHPADAAGIAAVHSIFNVGCAVLLFPFASLLVKLAFRTIPEKEGAQETAAGNSVLGTLDERFLDTPAFAVERCQAVCGEMADKVKEAFLLSAGMLGQTTREGAERIISLEQEADRFEDVLGTYLVKLAGRNLSGEDSRTVSLMLHCISDLERISDHAVNLVESEKELRKGQKMLTDRGKEELAVVVGALCDMMEQTACAFRENQPAKAREIEPLKEAVRVLCKEMKKRHIMRLRKGECSLEAGLVLEDILTDLERVAAHCSNIAVCLIQIPMDEYDAHEYLESVREEENLWFQERYRRWRTKYALPR